MPPAGFFCLGIGRNGIGTMGRPKAFTPEQELAVCEMYERVERTVPVAEAFKVSAQTICRVLEKHGIPRTHRHPESRKERRKEQRRKRRLEQQDNVIDWTDEMVDGVVRLYESGLSCSKIGDRYHCSWMTIERRLKERGVKLRGKGSSVDALMPQIMELHKQGLSDYEIASELGIGRDAVNYRLQKAGIHRGKGYGMHEGRIKSMRKQAIARFEFIADRFELLDYMDAGHALVHCKTCGAEFNWCSDTWEAKEPCPECRAANVQAQSERKQYEREQQREAAREWRLSVPRICKECGEPFYSERSEASYCCDACRKRVKNRKAAERRKRRGEGAGSYCHRMRITRTPATYDRTVTLGAVYKKFGGRCCACGCMTYRTKEYAPNQATLDHKIALANNGTHTWDNVQLLCSDCNSMKRDVGQMRLPLAV